MVSSESFAFSSERIAEPFSEEKAKDSEETTLSPPSVTSPSSESSAAKSHDTVEGSIEKESLTKSKTDTEPIVSEVQTNILECEKINVLSSENGSAILSEEKAKDSEETTLES